MSVVPPNLSAYCRPLRLRYKAYPLTQDYDAPTNRGGGFQFATREGYSHRCSPSGLHRPRLAVGACLCYLAPSWFLLTLS